MGKKIISLEIRENNKLIRISQVIFGLVCLAISIFWFFFNISSSDGQGTLWITVFFLAGFGLFQIYSGLGFAEKYIEFDTGRIKLRINSLLRPSDLKANDISEVIVFPLKIMLIMKSGKKMLIRLGVTNSDRIDLIKDEFTRFATENRIQLEIRNEGDI